MTRSTKIVAAAFLCAVAACATPAAAGERKVQLQATRLEGWKTDVLVGTYEVYENRQTRQGRKIALKIVVVPALAEKPAPDPVFYFAGGPGGSATATIERAGESYLATLRRDRDLVFVDQRGTGGSNPLECDLFPDGSTMSDFFAGAIPFDRLHACRDALGRVADLRLYSTPIAVDDLDEVRAALGYDAINLFGGSYGSTAAMAYMRQYPRHVRTATLLGVAPPDMHIPLPFAKGIDNAIDRLAADCAADPKCHAEFADPRADLTAALARLEKAPATFDAANPLTKQVEHVTMTRWGFAESVRMLLYLPEASRWLPFVLHRAAAGDFAPFAVVSYQVFRGIEGQIARGMHFSVVCGESVKFVTDEDVVKATRGFFYGAKRAEDYRKVCADWPKSDVPASFATPVASTAPVLMISGDADPVTPPWLAKAALTSLPNGRQVIVPHTGHFFSFPCVDQMVAAFVEKGSTENLDTSCLAEISRPAFVTTEMLQAAAAPKPPAENEELWEGALDVGRAKLRLVLHIAKGDDGALTASLDSPDQKAYGLYVDTIALTPTSLHFEMKLLNAVYDGKLGDGGSQAVGTWTQQGASFPLTLTRKTK